MKDTLSRCRLISSTLRGDVSCRGSIRLWSILQKLPLYHGTGCQTKKIYSPSLGPPFFNVLSLFQVDFLNLRPVFLSALLVPAGDEREGVRTAHVRVARPKPTSLKGLSYEIDFENVDEN
jgi:hypothetical protein